MSLLAATTRRPRTHHLPQRCLKSRRFALLLSCEVQVQRSAAVVHLTSLVRSTRACLHTPLLTTKLRWWWCCCFPGYPAVCDTSRPNFHGHTTNLHGPSVQSVWRRLGSRTLRRPAVRKHRQRTCGGGAYDDFNVDRLKSSQCCSS